MSERVCLELFMYIENRRDIKTIYYTLFQVCIEHWILEVEIIDERRGSLVVYELFCLPKSNVQGKTWERFMSLDILNYT